MYNVPLVYLETGGFLKWLSGKNSNLDALMWMSVDMDTNNLMPLEPNANIDDFSSGDTVRVNVRVVEGERTRIQGFEGVVIRRRGGGRGATFTVRRISYQVGVERTFFLYSPNVESVDVTRRGRVRRARLYYLRDRSGRSARIKEARRG